MMKTIWAVCQKDLRVNVYSARFFIAGFFFLIFMGAFFFYYVDSFVSFQQSRQTAGEFLPGTSGLISSLFGVLHFVMILLIPALTMGTFAEERRSGTLKHLLSSPISPFKVVSGKFLSSVLMLLLIFISSLVFPIYLSFHGNVSVGLVFSAYLGLILLSVSQLAFGLWVSSLSRNQFSAFLFTMFGLFLLLIANMLSVSVKGLHWTHSVIKYLGASGHLSGFLHGVIRVSDISYFAVFTLFFLFLTTISYDSYRWK